MLVDRAWAGPNVAHLRESARCDGVREEKREFSCSFPRKPRSSPSPPCFHLFQKNPPLIPAAFHHHQVMASEGNPKSVAPMPAAAHPASPPPSGALIPTTDIIIKDEATFVQPLVMIPAMGHNGVAVGATHRSADQSGRPTRGRDIHRPHSTSRSPSPPKMGKTRARAQSPYRRPSTEVPSPWKPIPKQLFKEGATTGSSVAPQDTLASPMPQKSALVIGQGATPT